MEAYLASRQVMDILRSYALLVEPLSLGETSVDVTAGNADCTFAVDTQWQSRHCFTAITK
jgi:nucleotidyltransferase/DNA polymerase involved in DNA repair